MLRGLVPSAGVLVVALVGVVFVSACTPKSQAPHGPIAPTVAPAGVQPTTTAGGPDISPSPARNLPGGRCGMGHMGALTLMPATSNLVLGLDLASITRHPIYVKHHGVLEVSHYKRAIEIGAACDVGLSTWRTFTMGSKDGNDTTMVLQAEGLGDRRRLECLRERAGNPQSFLSEFEIQGTDRIELAFANGSRGFVVDACTLVVADASAVEATRTRLAGRGASLLDGAITATLRRAGTEHAFWLAMAPFGESTSAPGARDMAMSVRLQQGVALDTSLEFNDPARAEDALTNLQREFAGAKSSLTGFGLPAAVVDSVTLQRTGTSVSIRGRADEAAFGEFLQKIGVFLAQM